MTKSAKTCSESSISHRNTPSRNTFCKMRPAKTAENCSRTNTVTVRTFWTMRLAKAQTCSRNPISRTTKFDFTYTSSKAVTVRSTAGRWGRQKAHKTPARLWCRGFGPLLASHSFQCINVNSFISIPSLLFIAFHSFQLVQVNPFISIHSYLLIPVNSFISSPSIHWFQFLHFKSCHLN